MFRNEGEGCYSKHGIFFHVGFDALDDAENVEPDKAHDAKKENAEGRTNVLKVDGLDEVRSTSSI